jgi:hypothetical protein
LLLVVAAVAATMLAAACREPCPASINTSKAQVPVQLSCQLLQSAVKAC